MKDEKCSQNNGSDVPKKMYRKRHQINCTMLRLTIVLGTMWKLVRDAIHYFFVPSLIIFSMNLSLAFSLPITLALSVITDATISDASVA